MTKKKLDEEPELEDKDAKEEAPSREAGSEKKAGKGASAAARPCLDELVLNYRIGKYSAIPLISLWAKELRKDEKNRTKTPIEILEEAMAAVLSGEVGWEQAKKALASGAAKAAAADLPGKLRKEK